MQLIKNCLSSVQDVAAIQHRNAHTLTNLPTWNMEAVRPGPLPLLLLFYQHTPVDPPQGPILCPISTRFPICRCLLAGPHPVAPPFSAPGCPPPPCPPWPTRLLCVTAAVVSRRCNNAELFVSRATHRGSKGRHAAIVWQRRREMWQNK